jgi:hypothetical protein
MSLKVVSFFDFKSASWSDDWTDQELAEFYRVEASLIRANVPIETDRGRSDEGDPWFVFCNANTGEIIVHFARFDGIYVVASPALDGCARGRDFRALIEAQLASHPLVIPKDASGGKLFIHPAALLIVLVATCFFKLSQTTAAAGELHEAQPVHPGVGSLTHSEWESQAVMLDERATAAVLAAIVTGIAWAQSHDFNLWSIGAALSTKIDVPSQDLSVSTSSGVAGPFDARRDLFHAHSAAAERETPFADIGGDPSTTSPGYRPLNVPNDHSAAGQTFSSFDTFTPAPSQTLPATSGPLSSAGSAAPSLNRYALQTEIMPISDSTVSSDTADAAVSSETTEPAQENSSSVGTPIIGSQNASPASATPTGSLFNSSGTSVTYALSTGNDTNASLGHSRAFTPSDLITGIVNGAAASPTASTFNPGDSLTLSGATITITDIANHGQNELAGVTLTGPFKFVVTEVAAGGGLFNFNLDSGATNVESLNSTNNVSFFNLAGANVEVGGAATATGTTVYSSYAAPTGPVSFQFDGGVKGVTIENDASGSAPTTETILSTGAANGSAANPDFVQATDNSGTVSSLTINATTSLVMGLENADFTSTATLTVSGAAALVDLTPGSDDTFSTVNASGLTTGALHLDASTSLTSFTGGGGGGNEVLYDGTGISASATAIDGGGGTGNILPAQLVNPGNGGIFTNWQILDITQYRHDTGFAAFDASALLPNDVITGVQLSGADFDAETVLNIAPAATAMVTGTGFTDAGLTITHSSATGDSLAVTFNNTDAATALNPLTLDNLTSTGDATLSIASTGAAGGTQLVGYNGIGTLAETDGHLKTVTVTGNDYFNVGYSGGVDTDSATTSTANITSALAKIDASATTGGVSIYAGNTTLDGWFWEVSYRGLTLDGGSGPGDVLYNGAAGGVTIDGNGEADAVWLGGSNASGALGTGASDLAVVGNSAYATAVTPRGPEAPGSALGDSVTFGAGATAEIIIGGGAEWDGSSYAGKDSNSGVGQTTVVGAVAAGGASPGTLIDLSHIVGASTNIVNAQGVTAGASNLTAAENTATAALGGVGVAYFTYGHNEFLVAAHGLEAAVSVGDAVVALHGVSITGLSMAAGVVHLV